MIEAGSLLSLVPLAALCAYLGYRLARSRGFRAGLDIVLAVTVLCLTAIWLLVYPPDLGGAGGNYERMMRMQAADAVDWFDVAMVMAGVISACLGLAFGKLGRRGAVRRES